MPQGIRASFNLHLSSTFSARYSFFNIVHYTPTALHITIFFSNFAEWVPLSKHIQHIMPTETLPSFVPSLAQEMQKIQKMTFVSHLILKCIDPHLAP
jgi:hypothetical protein